MDPNRPGLEPPPGVMSNFDDPRNDNRQANAGIAICLILVITSASLRAYSKIFCVKKVHIEDYLALLALGPYIAFVYGVYSLMNLTGYYVHQWDVRIKVLPDALYIIYISTSFFEATMGTLKTAILREWIRLFVPRGTKNNFYWACIVIMCLNILYYVASILASGLSCFPHEKIWNKTLRGTCVNSKVIFVSSASINLVSDLCILILPQRIIWRLHTSKQKKIAVSSVFAIGVMCETLPMILIVRGANEPPSSACLTAAVRLAEGVVFLLSDDVVYNISAVSLWCLAELSVAFVVFSLPAIPKVFAGNTWIKRILVSLSLWSKSTTAHSRIHDSGISSRKTGENAIRLQSVPRSEVVKSESSEQLRPSDQSENGILRTTRIDVRGVVVDDHQRDDNYNHQHTWMSNRDSPRVEGGYR
ncbi:hypothetical protein E0Z10_g6816 [Xylaria hypoxylon]|uniref:Rhodopsin domain-containing protein n=1 Tax=Xylaria hypoxylon TaxID=37992 RepID=A0A4Z0YWZ5_9PEZI|nr:hypothetical protein E0Z10_g6816 [Xylaria hypoxylon]